MVRLVRNAFAALISTFVLCGGSQAGVQEGYWVRDWNIQAYANDKTNEFSHCEMSAAFRNGISLVFINNSSRIWYMLLSNENWKLTPGEKYHFDIQLDGARGSGRGRSWEGDAVTPRELRVTFENASRMFELFSGSNLLTIRAVSATFRFSLANSRAGLEALAACTDRHLAASIGNPFEASPNPFKRGHSGDDD